MIYVLDGRRIHTLEDFWLVMGEAVNGPGGYFGRNLDAFSDCLAGGFGTPDDDDFAVEWHDHAYSQQALGHTETSRQLEIRLRRCHPTNRPKVASELAAARAGKGPTVFDWLVEIFYEQVPGALTLRSSPRAGAVPRPRRRSHCSTRVGGQPALRAARR